MRIWLGAALGGIFIYGTARYGVRWALVAVVGWGFLYVMSSGSRRRRSRGRR